MPGPRGDARRGGKNGQGVGNAIPRCKRWRTRREGMGSCGEKRKACHEWREESLQKAARGFKATTGAAREGFHPRVFLDLSNGTREELVIFLDKVELCGKWPQQACTTLFFLMPKNVASERPHCFAAPHSDQMVGFAAGARGGEVEREASCEMGCDGRAKRRRRAHIVSDAVGDVKVRLVSRSAGPGSDHVGLGSGQSFRPSASSSGVDAGDAFQLPRRILRVLCGHFEHPRRVQFEGSACGAAPKPSRPFFLGRNGVVCCCELCYTTLRLR